MLLYKFTKWIRDRCIVSKYGTFFLDESSFGRELEEEDGNVQLFGVVSYPLNSL